jgi:TetR/AcrR family transcriptional regulator, transcriptional repressor for nem operon
VARPKEFDIDAALDVAKAVFSEKGYDGTSTQDLCAAMKIGRQSFYDTFTGKREIFLAALRRYVEQRTLESASALAQAPSAFAGLETLLYSVANEPAKVRLRGCMGVGAMCDLGISDPEVQAIGEEGSARVLAQLVDTVRRAKKEGSVARGVDEADAAALIQTTLIGMRVLAKSGAPPALLRSAAKSALDGFRRQTN